MAYIISDHENPSNHPIYVEEKELGFAMLHFFPENDDFHLEIKKNQNDQEASELIFEEEQIWKLYFDGASSREGSGAGIVLISPTQQVVTISYK